jgi:hypothetical protein
MREIKFRAWDSEKKIMIGPFRVGSELSMAWPPEMQYTGLEDKNGKEIYEEDIILIPVYSRTEIHIVKWGNVGWGPFSEWNQSEAGYGANSTCLIIGNSYENPDLKAD